MGEATRYGKKLVVVDTPGLFDTGKSNNAVMVEIAKCYAITSPGLHSIILVVEIGRFTAEESKTVEFFLKIFGKNLENFLIVVFTNKDKLERDEMTIHEYVQTLPLKSPLSELLKRINNRYVVFGYKGNQQDRENEVQDLLNMIDDMVESNRGHYYTNEMYKQAEKVFRRRREEYIKREQDKRDKEMEEALKPMKENFEFEKKEMRKEFNQWKEEQRQQWKQKEKESNQEATFRQNARKQAERGQGDIFDVILNGITALIAAAIKYFFY